MEQTTTQSKKNQYIAPQRIFIIQLVVSKMHSTDNYSKYPNSKHYIKKWKVKITKLLLKDHQFQLVQRFKKQTSKRPPKPQNP